MHGTQLPRAFIALPVAFRDGVSDFAEPAPSCVPLPASSRPQQAADLHVTLAFLGTCERAAGLAAWRLATQSPPAFSRLKLAHPVLLGGGHAIVFDLAPAGRLKMWMEQHREAIANAAAGLHTAHPTANDIPRPHLTMAWLRHRPTPESAQSILAHLSQSSGRVITLGRMALWCRSDDIDNGGHRYRSLREMTLPTAAD